MKTYRLFLCLSILLSYSVINAQMSAEQLKKTTKEAYDAIIKHDLDKFLTYIADDAVDYGMGPMPIKGKMAITAGIKQFFGAFPDYKVAVEDIAVSGNRVYIKNNFKGTNTVAINPMLPATNKMINWSDTDIIEFDSKGKIKTHWANNPNEPLIQLGYAAFTNPNTSVVLAAYDAFSKGDVPSILAQCTNDVVFDVTDRVFLPEGKMYKGANEVPEFFKYLFSKVQFTKFEPYKFLADGDDVAVYINGEYKDNATGKMLSANILHQFKVVNGKITWFKGNTDAPKDLSMATAKK